MLVEQNLSIPPSARFRMELTGQPPYAYQMDYDLGKAAMAFPQGNPLLGNPYEEERQIARNNNSLFLPKTRGIPLWGIEYTNRPPELVDPDCCKTFSGTLEGAVPVQSFVAQNELIFRLGSSTDPLGLVQRVYEKRPDNTLRLNAYNAVGFVDRVNTPWDAEREWVLFTLRTDGTKQGMTVPVPLQTYESLQQLHLSGQLIAEKLMNP